MKKKAPNPQDRQPDGDYCHCTMPVVEELQLWRTVQCYTCKRPISDTKLRLIEPFPKEKS